MVTAEILEPTKRCGHCHQWLPLSAFGRHKGGKDGIRSECKNCVNEQSRARDRLPAYPVDGLERKCIDCGLTKPLSEFQRHGRGRRTRCRGCLNVHQNNRYASAEPDKHYWIYIRSIYKQENLRRARGEESLHYCTKCALWMPFNMFHKSSTAARDGLSYICKACHSTYLQERPMSAKSARRNYLQQYYNDNSDIICARSSQWAKDHPDEARVHNHTRRARLALVENTFTAQDWKDLVRRSPRCHWCGRAWTKTRRPTHDHIIAISTGGGNTAVNSVAACKSCNSSKQAGRFNPISGQGILL